MDYVLRYADDYLLDDAYAFFASLALPKDGSHSNRSTSAVAELPFESSSLWLPRDDVYRQNVSLFFITLVFAYIFYFLFSGLSYFFVYDHELMKHPKFLPNQIRKEISLSVWGFPLTSACTVPWFLSEVRGHSRLYDRVDEYGWAYLVFSVPLFLFCTDMFIYWIHRWLHHPLIYKHLHKPHHRWIVPTPFSSHAFHPLDGYLQSIPYHVFVFTFPLHKLLYMALFVFVNMWTIMIHDGAYLTSGTFINGAAHHTLHHLYFNYNYGQYFTLWDKIGGTYRLPSEEQLNRRLKNDTKVWEKQAREVDAFDENGKAKKA